MCEDLLDEMDIHEEALTLALRVRRHQFDANTGNLRSSAQITAQIHRLEIRGTAKSQRMVVTSSDLMLRSQN